MSLYRKVLTAAFVMAMTVAVIGQEWTLTTAPQANWKCIVSSADGRNLAAGAYSGVIYTSTNCGSTWTPTSAAYELWVSMACSADGSTLVAAAEWPPPNNGIYVSPDSGSNWVRVFSPNNHLWHSLACSSDGKRLVASCTIYSAAAVTNAIYISTNSGANWTLSQWNYAGDIFSCVASSADGSRLGAAAGAAVYTSTNFGLTWTPTKAHPLGASHLVATSGSGAALIALSSSSYPLAGTISISSDWGASWSPVGTLYNSLDSSSAACSDGVTFAVAESYTGGANPTRVSVSTNSGALWSVTEFSSSNLCAVTSSADGSRLALALSGHGIYVLQTVPKPVLKILPRAAGLQFSWLVPSEPFVLQESTDLSTWSGVNITMVFNYSNLNYEVELPRPIGPKFYRLSSL